MKRTTVLETAISLIKAYEEEGTNEEQKKEITIVIEGLKKILSSINKTTEAVKAYQNQKKTKK
jgi:hypothetical protein